MIDWKDDIFRIERLIRAVTPPFNGAFTFIGDKKIIIYDAQVFDFIDYEFENAPAGKIVEVFTDKKFLAKGYGGLLLINCYESKYVPQKGDMFGNNDQIIKSFKTNKYGNYDLEEN